MTQEDRSTHNDQNWRIPTGPNLASTHYVFMGVPPSASVQEIRRAYRELSKLYHPDTTDLPTAIATQKFCQLNEAYATLSSPKRRLIYDQKIGFAKIHVIQPPQNSRPIVSQVRSAKVSSTYPGSSVSRRSVGEFRPLSPGELFALFILGITFVACLVLAIAVGLTRGETAFYPSLSSSPTIIRPAVTSFNDQTNGPSNDQSVEKSLLSTDQTQDSRIMQPAAAPSGDPLPNNQSVGEQLPSVRSGSGT